MTSFNKPDWVLESIQSVIDQRFKNWELWVLDNSTDGETRRVLKESGILMDDRIIYEEIDIDEETRKTIAPSPMLMNKYYPQLNGEFILFLADDDLLDPDCLRTCVNEFAIHPTWMVVNFSLSCIATLDPKDRDNVVAFVPARLVLKPEEAMDKLDGGQVMHRKKVLDALRQPYFPESRALVNISARCDGYFLAKLAKHFNFFPIYKTLSLKRITPVSTWQRAVEEDSKIVVKWPTE